MGSFFTKIAPLQKELKMPIVNDLGEIQDTYIPRKCAATSRIIGAKDHAAVQFSVCDVDPQTGTMIRGKDTKIAICGAIRAMAESDDAVNRICQEKSIVQN